MLHSTVLHFLRDFSSCLILTFFLNWYVAPEGLKVSEKENSILYLKRAAKFPHIE